MTPDTNPATLALDEEAVQAVLSAIGDGFTPAEAAGIGQDQLEALYSLAYRLYSAGELTDAETAFRALCLYDYRDNRYWLGLGATLQALGKLTLAAEVYGMASLATNLSDPAPIFYAGLCQLKSGDLESADASFAAVVALAKPDDPKDKAVMAKASDLRQVIKEKLASQEKGGGK